MELIEFRKIVDEAMPSRSVDFTSPHVDPPATDQDIHRLENELGVTLPEEYVQFLRYYGGGEFGGVDVFSAKEDSDMYIIECQQEAKINEDFIAISPNGCGDYYGFRVIEGVCESNLSFWDHEEQGDISPTVFNNVFEYLALAVIPEEPTG